MKIGQQHADENGADEAGDQKQHQRLGKRHGRFQVAVQVHLGDAGDAHQFGVELAAFLRHGNHFQHGAGEERLAIRQALAEPAALLHALDGLGDGVHENLVADGAAGDVQALHERHARAEQRAEHPAESRHGELRDERADERRLQNHPSQMRLPFSEANQVRTRNTTTTRPPRRTIRRSGPDG